MSICFKISVYFTDSGNKKCHFIHYKDYQIKLVLKSGYYTESFQWSKVTLKLINYLEEFNP